MGRGKERRGRREGLKEKRREKEELKEKKTQKGHNE